MTNQKDKYVLITPIKQIYVNIHMLDIINININLLLYSLKHNCLKTDQPLWRISCSNTAGEKTSKYHFTINQKRDLIIIIYF